MANGNTTPPATKTYCVWADCNRRVYQHVEAESAEQAYRIAKLNPGFWAPCEVHDDNGYRLSDEVQDLETEEFTKVAGAADPDSQLQPASNQPRPPDAAELTELAGWLRGQGYEPEDAGGLARAAFVSVFDHYSTDGPGYAGKLMSVVWPGSPSLFDVFIWEDGQIVRSGRDYDERECYRCGAKNGTLCVNCWRDWDRRSKIGASMAASEYGPAAHTPGDWRHYSIGKGNPDRYAGPWESEERYMVGAFGPPDRPVTSKTICLLDPVGECEANARLIAAAPDLRSASQQFYDAVQDYIREPDSELPPGLVASMDELEAAWRKADGTGTAD